MSTVTLAVLDTDFEDAVKGVSGIVRRMTRVTPGGVLCLIDHDEDDLARAIIKWLALKKLSVFVDPPSSEG